MRVVSARTLSVLRGELARRPAAPRAIESLFWRALVAQCPPQDVALSTLERLDLEAEARLLRLDPAEHAFLLEYFLELARSRLPGDPSIEDQLDRESSRLLLCERAFERAGASAEAAAAYALVHDESVARTDAGARYEVTALRFKLGHSLFLLGEHELANLERCTRFGARTAEAVAEIATGSEWPQPAVRRLAFELHSWLGGRYEALGDLRSAAEAFLIAAIVAATAELRVSSAARAASALLAAEEPVAAREVLGSVHADLPRIETQLTLRLWENTLAALPVGEGALHAQSAEPAEDRHLQVEALTRLALRFAELGRTEGARRLLLRADIVQGLLRRTPEPEIELNDDRCLNKQEALGVNTSQSDAPARRDAAPVRSRSQPMRRFSGHMRGERYCGNSHKLEVHDLDQEHTNCQIDEIIRAGHDVPFDSLDAAHRRGYDNCDWCLGGSRR